MPGYQVCGHRIAGPERRPFLPWFLPTWFVAWREGRLDTLV